MKKKPLRSPAGFGGAGKEAFIHRSWMMYNPRPTRRSTARRRSLPLEIVADAFMLGWGASRLRID